MKNAYSNLLAQKLIVEFGKRNIECFFFETREDALNKILSMLTKDDVISNGGSQTLREIGFQDAMRDGGYHYLNPLETDGVESAKDIAIRAMTADYYFMSANAISETGEIVNIDGIGNRTGALMFGPKHVVIVAGMNKVMTDLESAIKRAKTLASRLCMLQYKKDYTSMDELDKAAASSGSHLVITSQSVIKDRIKIILIDEELGA